MKWFKKWLFNYFFDEIMYYTKDCQREIVKVDVEQRKIIKLRAKIETQESLIPSDIVTKELSRILSMQIEPHIKVTNFPKFNPHYYPRTMEIIGEINIVD